MGEKFAKIKDENKILIMLAFYSISIGLWTNFKQLWLQDNSLDVARISQILSISGLFCVIALLLFTKKISVGNIKKVITITILVKIINLIILVILNHTGYKIMIEISIILDTILETVVIIGIYPLIVTIKKENKLYSKRKLVEYLFQDIGILLGGIFIGKTIAGFTINYNICLLISILFLLLAYITILNIKVKIVKEKPINNKQVLRYMIEDKITRNYILCILISHIAMNTGLGLKMLMLTNLLGFSAGNATNYLLLVGLLADGIGILALKYLTPKNEYLTLTIKFGIRFSLYVIAFLSNNLMMCLIAMTWSILISTAYENVTDAPYINRIPNEYQIVFTNYRYIARTIGKSFGLYFAGIMYSLGLPYILGLSAFFMIFQMTYFYYLVYLRKKEKSSLIPDLNGEDLSEISLNKKGDTNESTLS